MTDIVQQLLIARAANNTASRATGTTVLALLLVELGIRAWHDLWEENHAYPTEPQRALVVRDRAYCARRIARSSARRTAVTP